MVIVLDVMVTSKSQMWAPDIHSIFHRASEFQSTPDTELSGLRATYVLVLVLVVNQLVVVEVVLVI